MGSEIIFSKKLACPGTRKTQNIEVLNIWGRTSDFRTDISAPELAQLEHSRTPFGHMRTPFGYIRTYSDPIRTYSDTFGPHSDILRHPMRRPRPRRRAAGGLGPADAGRLAGAPGPWAPRPRVQPLGPFGAAPPGASRSQGSQALQPGHVLIRMPDQNSARAQK